MIDLGPLAWMVHVAAAFAIAFFAQSVFGPKGREAPVVLRALIPVVLLTVLGAGWLPHPVAGMLIGYFGSRAFGRWGSARGGLLAALGGAVLMIGLGASWLIFPLFFMALGWLASGGPARGGRRAQAARELEAMQAEVGQLKARLARAGQAAENAAGFILGWHARGSATADARLHKCWKQFKRADAFWK